MCVHIYPENTEDSEGRDCYKTYVTTLRDNTVECHQDATTWAPVSNVHPAFADVKITSSDFINVPFCIYFIVVPFNLKSSTAAFFQDDEAC